MADAKKKLKGNVKGSFYVDETCIDCDTCRWMAPETFHEADQKSVVYHQPETDEEKLRAGQSLVSCPTSSIGTEDKSLMGRAIHSFPIVIEDNVFFCGYTSKDSFGAASYFIQRKDGNVLVDSPRFAAPLVESLEKLGGVRYLHLTHGDDVADHKDFHRHFSCERILHSGDVNRSTRDVEIKLRGHDEYRIGKDLAVIPVPGHTRGHTALLYRNRFLFTGDHLAYSPERNQLHAFKKHCWHSWEKQIESMERLKRYDFEWVLPGHGRRFRASPGAMKGALAVCISWMKQVGQN